MLQLRLSSPLIYLTLYLYKQLPSPASAYFDYEVIEFQQNVALDSRIPKTKQVKCLSKAQPTLFSSLAERLSVLQLGSQHVIPLRVNFTFKDHPSLKMSRKHLLFHCQEATDEPQM